jgi:hypothetical protein
VLIRRGSLQPGPIASALAGWLEGAWRWVPIATVVGIGLLERAVYVGQWPLGFRLTLEFDSANAARTIYLWLTGAHGSSWQQAWLGAHVGRFIEPPIMQTLTALTYVPGGIERPWTAAIIGTAFWVAAATFLFLAVARLTGWWGATMAAGLLVLAPFPESASQSFQPEPVLILGLAAVIWGVALGDVTVGSRFWLAALIGAFANLTKPGVLVPLTAAAYSISMVQGSTVAGRSWAKWRRLLALLALVTLPAFAYGLVLIPNQVGDKILPALLLEPAYYTGWFDSVMRVVGIIPLACGILGFALVPRLRLLGIGLGIGYLAYSALFAWHTMTHDYYHLPLVVLVAVGAGGLTQRVVDWARGGTLRAAGAAVGLAVAVIGTVALGPPNLLGLTPGRYDNAGQLTHIGELLGPGQRVLAYGPNYGKPLAFYGKLIVTEWPAANDLRYFGVLHRPSIDDEGRLVQMMRDFHPHYFVISGAPSAEIEALIGLLDGKFRIVASQATLRIYDLTEPIQTVSGTLGG